MDEVDVTEKGSEESPSASATDVVPRAPPKRRPYGQQPRPSRYARDRNRYLRNEEKIQAYQAKYYIENRADRLAYLARYRRENAGVIRSRQRDYRLGNPERIRLCKIRGTYRITPEDYNAMWERQGGKCVVCGVTMNTGRGRNSAHLDHDHRTGRVRAIICASCNATLGYADDDPNILLAAVEYLLEFVEPRGPAHSEP